MAVYFHGNFGLNRERMSSLLILALDHPDWKDKDLANPFGYGAPYAEKYRSWLHKTGISELRLPLRLTEKGKIVWDHDKKFHTITTQWFMHWELSQDPNRAEAWHYFVNEFLPQHDKFTKAELLQGVMMKLRAHSEEHFGPGSKLNPVIVRKLIECYTEDFALGELGFLNKEGKRYIKQDDLSPIGPWKQPEDLTLAFSD